MTNEYEISQHLIKNINEYHIYVNQCLVEYLKSHPNEVPILLKTIKGFDKRQEERMLSKKEIDGEELVF